MSALKDQQQPGEGAAGVTVAAASAGPARRGRSRRRWWARDRVLPPSSERRGDGSVPDGATCSSETLPLCLPWMRRKARLAFLASDSELGTASGRMRKSHTCRMGRLRPKTPARPTSKTSAAQFAARASVHDRLHSQLTFRSTQPVTDSSVQSPGLLLAASRPAAMFPDPAS